jgi:hypothetical protein
VGEVYASFPSARRRIPGFAGDAGGGGEAAAVARRDAELVADAAVVVLTGREPGLRRLLELLRAAGKPFRGRASPPQGKQ